MHRIIKSEDVQSLGTSFSRRALFIFGALTVVGCSNNKDTPASKKGIPMEVQTKDSLDYYREKMKKQQKRH